MSEEATLRDRLAIQRTTLAAERTLLAYVRTAIMLTSTGAVVLRFYNHSLVGCSGGGMLVAAGLGLLGFGGLRFRQDRRKLANLE